MPSTLEISANVLTTISIWLAGRNSVHTWWIGIVGCALFAWLFFESRLYADVSLQLFFIATSAAGWWRWSHDAKGAAVLPVTPAGRGTILAAVAGSIAATLCYGGILHRFTDAYAPFVDSSVLAFSVLAQLLLTQRKLQNWPFWLLVNTIAIPLYASRSLYLTAGLYAVYWINAVFAWHHWRRLVQPQAA